MGEGVTDPETEKGIEVGGEKGRGVPLTARAAGIGGMPDHDPIGRLRVLRYARLTPWVKAGRVVSPDGGCSGRHVQAFIDDELSLWIPEDSPWSQLATSSWWPLTPEAAAREVDAMFEGARAAAMEADFLVELAEWAAAEEGRTIFQRGLFGAEAAQHFTNQPPAPAPAVGVPAVAATDGRLVGLVWVER